MTKVSIIVPVYNVEQYLEDCLESLVNQTLKDIEILCVNDGSTDKSLEILERYAQKDERVKVYTKENGGQSSARNYAIPLAQGEFIGFVDSDDWIDLDFYEKLYEVAKKYNSEVACCEIVRVSDNNSTYFVKYDKEECSTRVNQRYRIAKLPEHNYVYNKIYNTKKLQKCGVLFEEGALFEDILWTHKVICYLQSIACVSGVKYYYRDNSYSTVNTKSDKSVKAMAVAYRDALVFANHNNIAIRNLKRYQWDERVEYKLFKIPLMVVKKYYGISQWYLFGAFLVFEKKTNYRDNRR